MPSEDTRDSADAEPAKAASERPREGEKKKKKRTKPPLPRTEREIDAPDRQTILMLGVMCFMTIVLWGFARAGCNYHPPRETRRPRVVKTEELARDPKDAALEMQQRYVQLDFDGALELSADGAEAEVKKRKADCAGKVQACAEEKKKNERTATTAALLDRDMGTATARVTSFTPPSGKVANIVRLERRGQMWKVVSLAKDDGSYKPKPAATLEMMPGQPPGMILPTPDASGSAAPPSPGGHVFPMVPKVKATASGAAAPAPTPVAPAPPAPSAKP